MRNKIAAILNLAEEEEKLKPLTERRPVASLPFGCRYRLIDFPFSSLYNAEVISAALFISGSAHSIHDHIRAGSTWGLDSIAGGGVFTHSQIKLKAQQTNDNEFYPSYYEDHYNYAIRSNSEYVLLIGSGILANVQLKFLTYYHEEKNSDVTVVYKNVLRDAFREDSIYERFIHDEKNNDCITGVELLEDISVDSSEISVGMDMMILSRETFLSYLELARKRSLKVNVKNFIEIALEKEKNVFGYEYTGYLKAIEDIKSYYEANMDMLDEEKFSKLFHQSAPILTKSKNSAPAFYGKSAKTKHSLFANDCEIYGTIEDSLIFRKVKIRKEAEVKNSIVMQHCEIEEGAEIDYAILDKNVQVKKGVKIKGTAENPIVIKKNKVVESDEKLVKEG